jgi:hypothetical protein
MDIKNHLVAYTFLPIVRENNIITHNIITKSRNIPFATKRLLHKIWNHSLPLSNVNSQILQVEVPQNNIVWAPQVIIHPKYLQYRNRKT